MEPTHGSLMAWPVLHHVAAAFLRNLGKIFIQGGDVPISGHFPQLLLPQLIDSPLFFGIRAIVRHLLIQLLIA